MHHPAYIIQLNELITFSGRLILSDSHPPLSILFLPAVLSLQILRCFWPISNSIISFSGGGVVWNLQDQSYFRESFFQLVGISPLFLHKISLKLSRNSGNSCWWKLFWRNLKPRPVWRLAGHTQGLEVGGWRVGGNDRRCRACAQTFKGRLSARKFGKLPNARWELWMWIFNINTWSALIFKGRLTTWKFEKLVYCQMWI